MTNISEDILRNQSADAHLRQLEQDEHNNFIESCKAIGEDLTFFHVVNELYATAYRSVSDEQIVPRTFMRDAQNQLSQAILTLLRGHMMPSLAITRKAVEDALYAYRILSAPDPIELRRRTEVWIDRDNEDITAFRNDFGERKLFPSSDPIPLILKEAYRRGCEGAHPSLLGHSFWVIHSKQDSTFSYFDIPTHLTEGETVAWLQRFLFIIFRTHIDILKVFYGGFGDEPSLPSGWTKDLSDIEIMLARRVTLLGLTSWKRNDETVSKN